LELVGWESRNRPAESRSNAKVKSPEECVSISLRRLLSLLALWPLLAAPAQAKHRETGFLDRTITLQGVNYKNGRSSFPFTGPASAEMTAYNKPTWALAPRFAARPAKSPRS
jgi:hypothetical protein